ncbi:MAG: T9SS type A sorting domain-containing protein, partial [Ignavibacteria bacterium]|nr:T9SS type A sorting domain-containing protein [Ignavibacteria bacterium]
TWETLTGSPNPKRYAGMAYLNGVIYLIGGLVPTGGDPVVCQKYDIATQSWGTIAPSLEALNFTKWSVSTDGRYVWLVGSGGGYSTYPSSNKVYYYDPIANSWQMESMLPAERGLALGLFLTGHNKLFFGGGNVGGSGTAFTNQCWEGTGGIYIPVELVSFSASANDGEVSLNWTTATETNNASFEIERSLDNIDYITISNLKGNGTTTEMHTYSFTDVVSISAKMFYRLKQIDFNGSFTYSKTIEVDVNTMPGDFVLSQNYPNPFNPSTTIKYSVSKIINNQSSIINLKVYDALGNEVATLVNEEKSPGNYEVEWNASGFASGVYFYRLKAGDFNSVKKLVLMK